MLTWGLATCSQLQQLGWPVQSILLITMLSFTQQSGISGRMTGLGLKATSEISTLCLYLSESENHGGAQWWLAWFRNFSGPFDEQKYYIYIIFTL